MTIAEQHRILSTEQLWVLHMHRETLGAYIRKHITTGYSRTLLSLAFPQRKVFAARDIRLSFIFGQLGVTLLLAASLVGLAFGLQPWIAGIAAGAFFALQASSLLEISRREPSPLFWIMSLFLFFLRNLCWLMGLTKALLYVIQSPPELDAAARWRERQDAKPADSDVKEAQTSDPQDLIERAKAETAN